MKHNEVRKEGQVVGGKFGNEDTFRVCVASHRGLSQQLSRCCGFEFEDVIADMDSADVVAPRHAGLSRFRLKLRHRLAPHTTLSRAISPGLEVDPPRQDYEIFFMLVQFVRDLEVYDALKAYRDRSRVAVCYLEEVWSKAITGLDSQLRILQEFDFVFVSCAGSVDRLSEVLQRPVHYIPPAVDALRFCPDLERPRCIDVLNIGRRSPVTHEALLKMATSEDRNYVFDTLQGPFAAKVPWQHRLVLANQVKHSRFFMANTAKTDRRLETEGQSEIGFRYFEGLAGGAVLLGDHPKTEEFEEHLGWPDSVIPVPFDCEEIADVIADLEKQPERLEKARHRNVAEVLTRHDWLHRWKTILSVAGYPESDGMKARARALNEKLGQFTPYTADQTTGT